MGLAFSSLWQRMFGKEERRILMVGLDAAGPRAARKDLPEAVRVVFKLLGTY